MGKVEELVAKRTDVWKIPPGQIIIDNPNVREDYPAEKRATLKSSIKEHGVITPIRVKKVKGEEKYILTHGFTRMALVWELIQEGCEILYVKAESAVINEEEELLQHIILNSGEPLTRYEISKILLKLKGYGWTNKKMSEKTGYTGADISKLLSFQENASTELKEAVAKGEIEITPAMNLAKEAPEAKKQNEILSKAREKTTKATAAKVEKESKKEVKVYNSSNKEDIIQKETPQKVAVITKSKIKAKDILSKKLSFQDKYTRIIEMAADADETELTEEAIDKLKVITNFYNLLSNRNLEPDEILKKFIS